MNQTLAAFARQKIKESLALCTEDQRGIFLRMYSPKNLDRSVSDAVDSMPDDKLDWALSQAQNTLKKTGVTPALVPSPEEIAALIQAAEKVGNLYALETSAWNELADALLPFQKK